MNSLPTFLRAVLAWCACCSLFGLPGTAQTKTSRPPATQSWPQANPQSQNDLRPRHALVIGNNAYATQPLKNPVSDAKLLSDTLKRLNFRVSFHTDLNVAQMREALHSFSRQLPKNAIALLYYAGHGIQLGGRNFLLPTDFKLDATPEAQATLLGLDEALEAISANSSLGIVILDACRNQPANLKLPATAQAGFAKITSPAGVLVAFSTAPGEFALDGDGANSPYAEALARNLLVRPSRIEDVFIKTRVEVFRDTRQMPWENSALQTVFYFTPDSAKPTSAAPASLPYLHPKLVPANQLHSYAFTTPLLNSKGMRVKTLNGTAKYYLEQGLEMVAIVGGKFQMGSGADAVDEAFRDAQRYNDEISWRTVAAEMPQHYVTVPGFYLSKYEITQGQWAAVMGGWPNIPAEQRGAALPVVNVTWRQANSFCEKLSQLTGRTYRLPTEAEWEYAARGGRETFFPFGDNLNGDLVNFNTGYPFSSADQDKERGTQSRGTLAPVGFSRTCNAFGLADMSGNVWEWCADGWNPDYNGAPADGSAWPAQNREEDALYRVVRGGSWLSIANNCRSASRRAQAQTPEGANAQTGFRVAAAGE